MTKKFIFNQWKIKEGLEQIASLINRIAVILSLALVLVLFFLDIAGLIQCFVTFLGAYIVLAYIGLGITRSYKLKRFKGHLALRWVVFILVIIELLMCLYFVISENTGYVGLAYLIAAAITAFQCLMNGYIK